MSQDPRIEAAVSAVKNATVAWSVMASGDSLTPALANICVDEIVVATLVAADKPATILLDTGLDLGDVERLREAVEDLEPGESFLLSHEFGVGILNLIARSAEADRERETMSRLNRDLIRDCANLTTRAETAERRNKGILAELSASGGRNIDLRQRTETAEATVARAETLTKNLIPGTERTPNTYQDTGAAYDEGHTDGWNEALAELARTLNGGA